MARIVRFPVSISTDYALNRNSGGGIWMLPQTR
jgi:hypothetical protein